MTRKNYSRRSHWKRQSRRKGESFSFPIGKTLGHADSVATCSVCCQHIIQSLIIVAASNVKGVVVAGACLFLQREELWWSEVWDRRQGAVSSQHTQTEGQGASGWADQGLEWPGGQTEVWGTRTEEAACSTAERDSEKTDGGCTVISAERTGNTTGQVWQTFMITVLILLHNVMQYQTLEDKYHDYVGWKDPGGLWQVQLF